MVVTRGSVWSINKILQFQANKHISKRAHFHAVTFTVNKQEWTGRPGNTASISGVRQRFYFFHCVQTGSGDHVTSLTMGNDGCFICDTAA
jgi:hypothetical protein